MKAIWRGHVIAESDRTLVVDGYRYFPREAVAMERLEAAPRSASDRQCPPRRALLRRGRGQERSERAAWSYEAPRDAMKSVDHWIGFWEDVEVR